MKHSIRRRIMVIFIGVMVLVIASVWAGNNWFLEPYYTSQKLAEMEETYQKLDALVMEQLESGESIGDVIRRENEAEWKAWNQAIRDGVITEDEFAKLNQDTLVHEIREYGDKNNMAIVLIDSSSGDVLLSSARDGDWLAQKVQRYLLGIGTETSEILTRHENYLVEKNYDPRAQSAYMESWGFFSDNSTLFIMQTPLANIRENAALSNRFTGYVGLFTLILGSILMYFVTRQVTKPILELAELSERMSHLDFEASYVGQAEDEIGVLGRSMNTMSDNLKMAIEELRNANRQLQKDIEEKTQIDEMRKEFIANVSHELKTPISLIQGYAEGLTEGMGEDPESRNYYCEVIMDEAGKMNKMVKQLLTLTALEFGNDMPMMERFDIAELICDLINSAGILIQQNQATVEIDAEGPIYVVADEFKIEEVLTNYLNNAMNHLSGERRIRIRAVREPDCVKVFVRNTGTPIPEEDLPNLWIKFFKVDKARTRAYGGSGIGLSIVKAIMDAHKQTCGVENKPDGVEFWFTLQPAPQEDARSEQIQKT